MNYTYPILMAIICFPMLSIILSLPFFIYYYRKYGFISSFRKIVFFSFVFYLLCAYFLVILPLPSIDSVINYNGLYYNLKPFYFISDFITSDVFNPTDISTYLLIFKNSRYLEAIFNILLILPFGIYMRYYFKCSFFKTFVLSFLLSLFFELTQLSGLYFIYPRPYRLFDINDLINNTLGGVIGFLLTPIFVFFLPSRDRLDIGDYIRGRYVTYGRRIVALIIDYVLVLFMTFGVAKIFNHFLIIYFAVNFVYFTFIPLFFDGYTFGSWIVKYKCINSDGKNVEFIPCIFRCLFVNVFLLNSPIFIYMLFNMGYYVDHFTLFYLIITGLFFLHFLYCLIFKKTLFYEKLFKIEFVSVVDSDEYEEI